jgi:hypothetical protein
MPAAIQIQTFVVDPFGYFATIGFLPPSPFTQTAPFYAVVRGVRYPRGWTGVHSCVVVDPTHVRIGPLRLPGRNLPPFQVGDRGTIQTLTPTFVAISSVSPDYITHRKQGRPFGSSRGRGPAR